MNKKFGGILALIFICLIAVFIMGRLNSVNFKSTNAFITLAENNKSSINKSVYLTFDDGPSDRVTPQILDVLKEEGVQATFFIIGRQAEIRKPLVKRAFEEGHTIAVHSYSHEYDKIYASPFCLLNDIERCNKIIEEITGAKSKVYRFPGGSFNLSADFIQAVAEQGYSYVDWNASTRDAEVICASSEQIYQAAVNSSANRQYVVLLAHDSTKKSTTAQALKNIIKYYKQNGYSFYKF